MVFLIAIEIIIASDAYALAPDTDIVAAGCMMGRLGDGDVRLPLWLSQQTNLLHKEISYHICKVRYPQTTRKELHALKEVQSVALRRPGWRLRHMITPETNHK